MLDVSDKKRDKEIFSDYLDSLEARRQINDGIKEFREEAATILECKEAKITQLFNFMRKKLEDGVDELDEFNELMSELSD